MNSLKANRTSLIFVISFAVLFYSVIALSLQLFENSRLPEYIPKDEQTYFNAAKLIYNDFKVHPTRPMLFPSIAGIPFIFGIDQSRHYFFAFALNIISWLSTVILIFYFLQKTTSFVYSVSGSILFIINTGNIAITNQVLTESVYTLLLTIISIFFYFAIVKGRSVYYSLAFLAMSASILIKPSLSFALIIFLVIVIYKAIGNFKLSFIKKKSNAIYLIAASILILQSSLMKKEYGNFTLSYIDRLAWYYYIGCQSFARENGMDYNKLVAERMNSLSTKSWNEIDELCIRDLKTQFPQMPFAIFRSYFENIFENSTTGSYGIFKLKTINKGLPHTVFKKVFYAISIFQNIFYSTLCIILFLVLAVKLIFRRSREKLILYLFLNMLLCLFLILSSGVSFLQGDRFHIVIVPVCIITLIIYIFKLRNEKSPAKTS